jgi:hypothetical protein
MPYNDAKTDANSRVTPTQEIHEEAQFTYQSVRFCNLDR